MFLSVDCVFQYFWCFGVGPLSHRKFFFKKSKILLGKILLNFLSRNKTCSIVQKIILKVIYLECRLFTLEFVLQERVLKWNFEIKISNVKGALV